VKIYEFLLALANDPELLARFESEPGEVLEQLGITGDAASLLLAGKLVDLRVKIVIELEIDGEIVAFETIWWIKKRKRPPRA
jgi:hypothetical protein